MTLEQVTRFCVPEMVVEETERALRIAGQEGFELFILWTGLIAGETFAVKTCHRPEQTAYKLETGLCVRINGEALHHLNHWLFEHGEVLGVQVHSHPTDAFHSETDDTYPIVTALGGLSLVVPDFCRRGLRDPGIVAYRLQRTGWVESPQPIRSGLLELGY